MAPRDLVLADIPIACYAWPILGDGTPKTSAEPNDDVPLLRAVADGDKDALRILYDRHSSLLYSLALRILTDPSDAEDVLQETFVQAWKSAGLFDATRSKPLGWLVVLVRSRAIDRLRSRNTRARATENAAKEDLDPPVLPGQEVAASESHELVRRALESLPTEQRTPIELAYFRGLSQTEIAERLSTPLGTIKTRMRLGMHRLREQFGSTGLGKEVRP